jgi:FKBP-type peptidyl-prolyl cis-trans isomerase FkpA
MKQLLLLAGILFAFCSGCSNPDKGCMPVQPKDEEQTILNYAASHGITPTKHSSGLYYQVINPGTGAVPNMSSRISVTYTGKLLNDAQFDQATSAVTFTLSGVIEGWRIGIPLISKGGKIKLIIPSALAYSCVQNGPIPSNSVLYFDIDLLDVQ